MTGAACVSVFEPERSLGTLNKTAKELLGDNVKVKWEGYSGTVVGDILKITGWKEFSNDAEEQNGHYFPVALDSRYTGKTITCVGSKEKQAIDLEWVLRVDKTKKFTFKSDGQEIFTLDFNSATLK